MEYQIVLAPRVQKDLARVDGKSKDHLMSALLALGNDPYLGKCLKGELSSLCSYEVWPYRIVYEVMEDTGVVLITRIRSRIGS